MNLPTFSVREVNLSDSDNLLAWRNDDFVRQFQGTERNISITEHEYWLARRLHMNENLPFLAYVERSCVLGYTRLDAASSGERVVSILISPSFRGQGYGSIILSHFLLYVRSKGITDSIFAYVHNGNIPSQRLFRSLSFKELNSNKDQMMKFVYE